MKAIRVALVSVAIFQALSTLIGFVQLLVVPQWFAAALEGTPFAGQFVVAALLLGVVVGGVQWAAIGVHRRAPQWQPLAHSVAGVVMIGWIFGECLVMDSFVWAHALWGGMGVVQLVLVLLLLGVARPHPIG